MEADTVTLVQPLDLLAHLAAEHAFEGNFLDGNDIDFGSALAQRRRGFERDETRPHDDGSCPSSGPFADSARIVDGAQCKHVVAVEAGLLQPVWLRSGGNHQPVVWMLFSRAAANGPGRRV